MTTEITTTQLTILATTTTRDEAGRHFTQTVDPDDLEALEAAGLVDIERPVHEATGISFSQEYWHFGLTEAGQAAVDAAYIMRAEYRCRTYTGIAPDANEEGAFNAAWEAIAAQLPDGEDDDVVDLGDAGCVGGSLRWLGGAWAYDPRDSRGVAA